ncbi:MAG: hypothetical protein LBR61_06665 [Synergistaceae bacterium]|nr:hypothetical protein [Synergistaceae bacterium]
MESIVLENVVSVNFYHVHGCKNALSFQMAGRNLLVQSTPLSIHRRLLLHLPLFHNIFSPLAKGAGGRYNDPQYSEGYILKIIYQPRQQ